MPGSSRMPVSLRSSLESVKRRRQALSLDLLNLDLYAHTHTLNDALLDGCKQTC